MAKPLVAVETIYDAALEILDERGPEGLSARSLAAALGCSTRTLYQQVGRREELTARLLDHYFTQASLDFTPTQDWRLTIKQWCTGMRSLLLAHPNLSRMIGVEHRGAIARFVNELLVALRRLGFEDELALRTCRVLTNVVISLTLAEITTPAAAIRRRRRRSEEIQFEDLLVSRRNVKGGATFQDSPEIFDSTVDLIIAGLAHEAPQ